MATNYTGSATATQAPSGAPTPGGSPIGSLPADGDPRNAAAVAQMAKVALDWIAWLFSPRARSAAWAEAVVRFKSALLHTRFGIDHLGLPGGRIQQWNEMWERGIQAAGTTGPIGITGNQVAYDANFAYYMGLLAAALGTAGVAANLGAVQAALTVAGAEVTTALTYYNALSSLGSHWQVRTLQTSGLSELLFPGTASQRHNSAILVAGDTAGDFCNLWRPANVAYHDDLTFALEWEAQLQAANLVTLTASAGFCQPNLLASGGAPASHFACFQLAPGGGNWFIKNRGGGATNSVDTGIAATTAWTRFRIEFHGGNVADDLTRAMRFYINGTQVGGDVTTNVPLVSAPAAAAFSVVNTAGGASGVSNPLIVGPVRFVSNIYGSDVF